MIGYTDEDYNIKTLHVILPETNVYEKVYDGETKWVYVLVEDDELLEKYDQIWNKVSDSIKKFGCEPIFKKGNSEMRRHIFITNKCLKYTLIIFVEQ